MTMVSDIITTTLDERLYGLTSIEAYYGNDGILSSEPKQVIICRDRNEFIVPSVGKFNCIKLAYFIGVDPLDFSKPEDREYLRGKWIVSKSTGLESMVTTFGRTSFCCNVIDSTEVGDLWYVGSELFSEFTYLYSKIAVGRIKLLRL